MAATPAWPPKSLPRLFVRTALGEGATVELDAGPANYLGNVLRLGPGAELLIFDGVSGEWLARIAEAGKKRMMLIVERRTREPETIPDVWLAFAPVKRSQTDWLVEKATELGTARLLPVMTQRTVAERVRLERLEAIAIEAADRDPARTLDLADEAGGEWAPDAFTPGPCIILTGPEGGFTDDERAAIRAAPNSLPVSLGPRILRAETAALVALSVFMAVAGDWKV